MIVNKTPIFINIGFCFSTQYSIFHTHHFDVPFVEREQFLNFICNGLHLQDFLWWGLGKTSLQDMVYHPIPWWGCPPLDYMMHPQHSPMFFFSSSIRGLVPIFYLIHLYEFFCILFDIFLCRAFIVYCIVKFFSTIIVVDGIKVSSYFILFLFHLHHPQFYLNVQT